MATRIKYVDSIVLRWVMIAWGWVCVAGGVVGIVADADESCISTESYFSPFRQ